MSNRYKHGDRVPSDVLCNRLNELADAVTEGQQAVAREFTMRIPAEFDRDADLVMAEAASRLRSMSGQVAAGCDLESRNNNDRGKQNAS